MSLDHPKPPLDLSPVQCPGKQSQPACCLSDLVLIEVPQYLSIVFQALRIKWCILVGYSNCEGVNALWSHIKVTSSLTKSITRGL